jgi:prolycopene isomerase
MCHGVNGAPPRQARGEHGRNAGCAGCHAQSHAGVGLPSPSSCIACHRFSTADQGCGLTLEYDAVVVGAGGGGLAAAAALARAGMSVALLERHTKVGGAMTAFRRGDYRFEVSLHGFDGLDEPDGMNVSVFKALDIWQRVERVKLSPMYRAIYPDFTVDVPADADQYLDLLVARFPEESAGIRALFTEMKEVDRILKSVLAAQARGEDLATLPVADLERLLVLMDKTLAQVLDDYLRDPKLVAV